MQHCTVNHSNQVFVRSDHKNNNKKRVRQQQQQQHFHLTVNETGDAFGVNKQLLTASATTELTVKRNL